MHDQNTRRARCDSCNATRGEQSNIDVPQPCTGKAQRRVGSRVFGKGVAQRGTQVLLAWFNRRDAVFDRVIPRRNFNIWSEEYGWGAWQVGIRYGYVDLQNKGVNGATLNDIVLGLNWFLNPNMKIQWNLAIDHRESTPQGSSGWTYIFGSRVALDF